MSLPPLERRLAETERLPTPVKVAALLAGIDAGTPGEADLFVSHLLEIAGAARGRRSRRMQRLLVELFRRWPVFGLAARRAVALAAGGSLVTLIANDDQAASAVLPDLVQAGPLLEVCDAQGVTTAALDAGLAALLRILSREEQPDIATRARKVLPVLAQHLGSETLASGLLDRVIAIACHGFAGHRDDAPIAAALMLASRPGPEVAAWLAGPNEPGHLALRRLAKGTTAGVFDANAASWLARPALAGHVLKRMSEQGGLTSLPGTLTAWALLARPSRVHSLRRAGRLVSIMGDTDPNTLSERARLGLIVWCVSSPGSTPERAALVARSLRDPSASVRAAAVRALGSLGTGTATLGPLTDFAFDLDARGRAIRDYPAGTAGGCSQKSGHR